MDFYKVYDYDGNFIRKFTNEEKAIKFADSFGFDVVYDNSEHPKKAVMIICPSSSSNICFDDNDDGWHYPVA